ncbi:hypothetical protein AOA81_04305 [Methanomassiliicoccales archaeon RumEn M2]|nr:hypothetical protein AOA81_04305 [Methanomassiliicoccales archaeon RumEn M2]
MVRGIRAARIFLETVTSSFKTYSALTTIASPLPPLPVPPPSMPRLIKRSASTGPMAARPTMPKLSISDLPGVPRHIPRLRASNTGTIIGPVATPPESKAMPRKASGAMKAMMIMAPQPRRNMYLRGRS